MVFSSMTFVSLFFPLVFLLCLAFDSIKAKNTVLLIFSLLFYAWGEPVFVFIMLLTVLTNYVCGLLIDRSSSPGVRKLMLVFGLVLSLSFLFFLNTLASLQIPLLLFWAPRILSKSPHSPSVFPSTHSR